MYRQLNFVVDSRGVARLATSGGQERNISLLFLILLLFSFIFPEFFLIFFLNLMLRVGNSPTQEGPDYATGRLHEHVELEIYKERSFCSSMVCLVLY